MWGHSLIQLAEDLERRGGVRSSPRRWKFITFCIPPPFTVRQALEYFEPFFEGVEVSA